MGRILVVDDERSMREFLAICLRRAGHAVTIADSGTAALESLAASPADIVVTDLRMPGELASIPRSSWSRPSPPPTPRSRR
jgi:CheY-like chemotaxis protein